MKKTTPEQIIAAIRRTKWSTDPRYIPYPATWLNQERWADEPAQSPTSTASPAGAIDPLDAYIATLPPQGDKLVGLEHTPEGLVYTFQTPIERPRVLIRELYKTLAKAARFAPTATHFDFGTVIEWLHAGIPYPRIFEVVAAEAERWYQKCPTDRIRTFRFFDRAVRAIGPGRASPEVLLGEFKVAELPPPDLTVPIDPADPWQIGAAAGGDAEKRQWLQEIAEAWRVPLGVSAIWWGHIDHLHPTTTPALPS